MSSGERFWMERADTYLDQIREVSSTIVNHFEGDAPSDPEDVLKRIYFDILDNPREPRSKLRFLNGITVTDKVTVEDYR